MDAGFDLHDLMRDWSPPLGISFGCTVMLAVYLRGFVLLGRTRPDFGTWRAWCFGGGLVVLWLALASPLEELADTVLTAHMVEHLLLMSVVPPLLLLGWPTVPLLRGIPGGVRRWTLAPLIRSRSLRGLTRGLTSAPAAWVLMNATLLLWHVPAAYDFALEHEFWHDVEHVCFLSTSMLFWWVLLQPWPSHRKPLGWWAPIYLVSADFVNTVLSATLAFVGHPVYSYYLQHGNGVGLDPLDDQTIGASVMWVFGSLAFLGPAVVLVARLLQGEASKKPMRPA